MTDNNAQPSVEYALLRSELLLPLTEMRADIRLILQRMDQGDARAADHAAQLKRLDERVDALERTTVTREEWTAQKRHYLAVWALVVTVVGIGAAVLTNVITTIATTP